MKKKLRTRNKWEAKLAGVLSDLCDYEPFHIPYVVHRKYTPDFVGDTVDHTLIIEAKGYFREGDTLKYKSIRDSLSIEQELIFILYEPNKKVRKGARLSMAQWCEKEGLRWFTDETILDAFTT